MSDNARFYESSSIYDTLHVNTQTNNYAGIFPSLEEVPLDMQTVTSEFRQRPAYAFAQRMYDLHRAKATQSQFL